MILPGAQASLMGGTSKLVTAFFKSAKTVPLNNVLKKVKSIQPKNSKNC